jgi:uncharacterized protein YqgC (DUF456 family)
VGFAYARGAPAVGDFRMLFTIAILFTPLFLSILIIEWIAERSAARAERRGFEIRSSDGADNDGQTT